MKTLFLFFLIIALATACNGNPDVVVSARPSPTTLTTNATATSGATQTQVPSNTSSPTIAMPSETPFPTPTFPPECGTPKLGKPGTQEINSSNAPSVLVQGTATLCTNHVILTGEGVFVIDREAILDLDTGLADTERADVVFDVLGSMNFYLISHFNHAVSQYWSLQAEEFQVKYPPQPTYDQCKEQYIYPGQSDNEPAYLCVITNEGHVSRVKVEDFNPVQEVQSMSISFVTWSEVVVHP